MSSLMRFSKRAIGILAAIGLLLPLSPSFAASTVSATYSSMSVSATNLNANYQDSAIVSVYARDTNGFPVPGKRAFLTSSPFTVVSQPAEMYTDANGLAQFTVRSSQVGNVKFYATVDGVMINQNRTINFSYSGYAVSPFASQVSLSKNVAASNGIDQVTVTVTLRDSYGNLLTNRGVTFFSTFAANSPVQFDVTTDIYGKASIVRSSSVAGTEIITTRSGGVDLNTVSIQYGASNISTSRSSFSASPTSIIANGSNYVYLTAAVRDTNGNALPNKTVTVTTMINGQTTSQQYTTDYQGNMNVAIQPYLIGTAYLSASVDGVTFGQATVQQLSPTSSDQTISMYQSYLAVSPSTITLDGASTISVTVYIRNSGNQPLSGKPVQVFSSNIPFVMNPPTATTDQSGIATFQLRPLQSGVTTLSVRTENMTISQQPSVTVVGMSCPGQVGALFKLPNDGNPATQSDSAVYYYGRDCKRHAFPNAATYFSWFPDFNSVQIWNTQTIASIPLGKNITFRPGAKMIKFPSTNSMYMVSKGGILRRITSEYLAQQFWGVERDSKLEIVPDTFFTNYIMGPDIWYVWDYNVGNEYVGADINA